MQNFIITLVLFLLSLFVSAQEAPENFKLEKGTWSMGGAFSIGASERTDKELEPTGGYNNFSFNISPAIGYFLADNLELGAKIGYGFSNNKYDNSSRSEYSRNTFVFSPYLRKFFSLGPKFAFSVDGSLDFSTSQTDDFLSGDQVGQQRNESYGIGVQPGVFFLLSDKFTLNANIGNLYYAYSESYRDGLNVSSGNQFGLNANLGSIWLGLRYYIN